MLLTGGLGFLGRAIIAHAPADVRLLITDRTPADTAPDLGHSYQQLDILDFDSNVLKDVDVVIHNAGVFDLTAAPEMLERVNVLGSQKVATAAVRANVQHFIQVSSTSVYGPHPIPISEDVTPKNPVHSYGQSKWRGEVESQQICESAQVPWSTVRPTLIYGPRSRYGIAPFIAMLHRLGASGRTLPLPSGGSFVHAVHVDDVARAIWHVCKGQHLGPFTVSDETPIRFGVLLQYVAEALEIKSRALPLPWALIKPFIKPSLVRPILKALESSVVNHRSHQGSEATLNIRLDEDWCYFLTSDYVFSNDRLRASGFEFAFPDVKKGLESTIAWYRNENWL